MQQKGIIFRLLLCKKNECSPGLEQLLTVKWDAGVCWAAIVAGNCWDPFLLSGHVQRFL